MTNSEVQAAQRDLIKLMEGSVVNTEDIIYRKTVSIDNGRVNRKPYLVTLPSSTNDVSEIIKYCRDNKIRVTIKCGGHSATGYCLNSDGIVLDMKNLNTITTKKKGDVLSVGMGTHWIQVYNYLQQQQSEYMVVGGGCGGVGLGGFLLGGGYSFISRSYGLGSDSIKKMKFVSGDGTIHTLDEKLTNKNEIDLYWALRGSGGGNFGVVTEVDLKLHKMNSKKMMMGYITFPFNRIQEVLKFYNTWVITLPSAMAVYGMIRRFPDPSKGGEPILSLRLVPLFNGDFLKGKELIKPLLELQPQSIELYNMTIPEWENYIGGSTTIDGRSAYIRSAIMPQKSLNNSVSDILYKFMNKAPSKDSFVVWTHTGGNINNYNNDSSCFAHRDGEFTFELKSIWNSGEPQNARANIEWAVKFFDELEKYSQGAYLNYIDPLLVNWQTKYYRTSYKKLLKIKKHWDPKGQFDFQQSIGSRHSPTRTSWLDLSPLYVT